MNKFLEFTSPIASVLNYPFIVLGTSQITLAAIILNTLFVLVFLFASAKVKNWLINSLAKKPGLNISNWRAAITLTYYTVLLFGLFGILQSTGVDLSIFAVLTGAIGIGVGFGMQAIFSNFISGIIILLEKPLKLGDRIEVGTISGNVHSISVRATTINTNDNVSYIIPNSDFITKQVINWSHSDKNVRIRIFVTVPYATDPSIVEKLLLDVANQEPGVLKTPPPEVHLVEFGESGLKFGLLVWTNEYCDRPCSLKSLLNFSVLRSFREKGLFIHPEPKESVAQNLFN